MPYELRLAQRRAMMGNKDPRNVLTSTFVGLYLVRLQAVSGDWFPSSIEGGNQIGIHVTKLLREAMRDSDIPFKLSDNEHLVVLRDIDPQHAYVVAQRFLTLAGRSDLLRAAGLGTRVGYVIYPLSTQPNFPVDQWETLIDLARTMSDKGDRNGTGIRLRRSPRAPDGDRQHPRDRSRPPRLPGHRLAGQGRAAAAPEDPPAAGDLIP